MRRPGTAPATRAAATAAALALGSLLVAVGAVPASAHASLVRASPADRSSVASAPAKVSLTFDENIRVPSVILVTDANGGSVVQGRTSVLDNIVSRSVRIPESGDYTVVYRVVSADGHPVSGRLTFGLGAGNSGATVRSSGQAPLAGHQHNGSSTSPSNGVIGMIASLALAAGVGLLTIRRWAPNLWSRS